QEAREPFRVLPPLEPPQHDRWQPVGKRMPAEVAQILGNSGGLRMAGVPGVDNVIEDGRRRLQDPLDERPRAALLVGDLPDVEDYLVVGPPIHGANMAEKLLKVRTGAS